MDILFFWRISEQRRNGLGIHAAGIAIKNLGNRPAYLLAQPENRYAYRAGALAFATACTTAGQVYRMDSLEKQLILRFGLLADPVWFAAI